MKEFDVVVIGGGPGGYVSAIRGAQKGAKVALVEKDRVGGTCLNRGCIPTKALYYSARSIEAVRRADNFGVKVGRFEFDLARAVERKDEVVGRLVSGVEQLLKGNGVEVFRGEGFVEAEGRVVVKRDEGSDVIGAKKIIIATGSEPAMIPAFNIDRENVLTSTEVLNLKEVPESLLIIGGGIMGCEFAVMFSIFGSSVKVVELLPEILSGEDRAVVRVVLRRFKELGIDVLAGVSVEAVEVTERGVKTSLTDGREFITEKVLVTIGRSFNSSGLGLEALGVEVDEKGRIVVNERMETSVNGIYAIGDVTGGILLAHVASSEGITAVSNALGESRTMDYSVVPYGIFTEPEIAGVGLKEKEAKERGMDVKIGRFPYGASGKALGMGEVDGFVQILSDPSTDRVLGCSIVGAHATDLIGEVAIAMKLGAKTEDIAQTIHAHPTLPEIVMEAAEDVHGFSIHKIGRRR